MTILAQTVRMVPLSVSKRTAGLIRDGQKEAAKVYMACRDAWKSAIVAGSDGPGRNELQALVKGKFALHSQSAQMVCHAFLGNVATTRKLRAQGRQEIRYPYRDKIFFPLMWPAQAMSIEGNRVILPMGRGRSSIVLRRPEWLTEPCACELIWNRNHYELHLVITTEVAPEPPGENQATIDLGQIHQCAVTTSTGKGLIVSGRGIRSEKRKLNKMHGTLARRLSKCKKGSRRWKKLRRSRNRQALCAERKIADMRHKGTRQAIDFCQFNKVGRLYVGDPDGVRKRCCGRVHNQRMSQWEYGKDKDYLAHKSRQAGIASFNGSERGTSSHCPQCGHHHKPKGRQWVCTVCRFSGHRDLVGSANMHPIAFGKKTTFPASNDVTYLRPGTSAKRVLDRSSRPGAGHGAPRRVAARNLGSTTATVVSRAPQGAGHTHVMLAEAHPL